MTALLSLRGVTRTVLLPNGSELPILKGVDLKVHAGEKVAIVGQSGTGKSTLLNIIGMLDLPDSGEYLFAGEAVAQLSETRRSLLRGDSFGFIFQQFNLFMTRTALNNVEVPLLYSSDARVLQRSSLAAQMLERVGLGDRLDSMPGEFSGGEQQRVAIARALVRRPKVILADEPTGALDLNTGKLVMDLLEEVATEQNAALITITHDMSVAARAQSVYEIIDGRLHPVTAETALQQLSAERHLQSSPASKPPTQDTGAVASTDVTIPGTAETALEVNDA